MSEDFIEKVGLRAARVDHDEGIYFGMSSEDYFADIAIGSTDARTLAYSPPDYWFGSRYNPLREGKESTPAQLYGSAVHTLLLEGRQKFESLYAPKRYSWSTKEGKAEKERFAERGLLALPEDAWGRAQQTGAVLAGNRYLAEAFSGSVGHEVSVFWKRDGIKWRARFDALKERAIVDLKNVSNERAIAFPKACARKISDYGYHGQAALYTMARLEMGRLLDEGRVHGDHDPATLRRVVDAPAWAFCFIFLQSAGAPCIWATKLSFQREHVVRDDAGNVTRKLTAYANPLLELGFARIEKAAANWKKFHGRFGTDVPWVSEDPIEEFDITAQPPWAFRDDDAAT
jgi:hypothetical protein